MFVSCVRIRRVVSLAWNISGGEGGRAIGSKAERRDGNTIIVALTFTILRRLAYSTFRFSLGLWSVSSPQFVFSSVVRCSSNSNLSPSPVLLRSTPSGDSKKPNTPSSDVKNFIQAKKQNSHTHFVIFP